MNYYELFNLQPKPVFAKDEISKTYIALQRKYHPDFSMDADETEKENLLQLSADVNKAYQTFTNANASLFYFLKEKGIITEDEKYQLPPDFLMEMMELNEELDEGTTTDSSSKIQETIEKLEAAINLHNCSADTLYTAESLADLKSFYYKKKYLLRILDRLGD